MYHSVYTVIYYDITISIHALIHDDTWYDYRIYWRERFQVMKFLRKLWQWVQWSTPLVPYPNATMGHVSATSCNTNIPLPSLQHSGVPVHHGKISLLLFDPLCSYCMHVGCMSMLFDPLCSYCMHVGCMSMLFDPLCSYFMHVGCMSMLFDPLCSYCMHVGCMSMLFDPLCSYCMHVGCMSKLCMTHTPILKAFCNYCINLHVFIDHCMLDFFLKKRNTTNLSICCHTRESTELNIDCNILWYIAAAIYSHSKMQYNNCSDILLHCNNSELVLNSTNHVLHPVCIYLAVLSVHVISWQIYPP